LKKVTKETHAIVVPDPESETGTLSLPFLLKGVTSYLPVRKPTMAEWNSDLHPIIDLTSEHLDWDPTSTSPLMDC